MRNQTISTSLSDAAELLAEPIDPTGWLAGPGPAVRPAATRAPEPNGRGGDRIPGARRVGRPARRTGRPHHRPRSGGRIIARQERLHAFSADSASVGRDAGPAGPSLRRVQFDETPDGYRMGRWARLAITVTVLAAAAVLAVSLTAGAAPARLVDVTVGPGDTLWSIATGAAPDRDPRAVIDEIRELNDVPGTVLPVGVVLRVPVSAG